MVLDPTFNTDAMAAALGIPSSKHMVRRHLVEEMKILIDSARWEKAFTTRRTFQIMSSFFCKCCTNVCSTFEAVPDTHASSHVPCRADAKQDCEHLGTPPTLLRQNSMGRPSNCTGRHTDDDGSLRRRAVKVGKKDGILGTFMLQM